MERTIHLPAAADEKADKPLVEKPPAETPISSAWEVFDRMVVPARMSPQHKRALTHAFYAGARAAYSGVVDALQEIEGGKPEGDTRLEMIEREIDQYFVDLIKQAAVSRTGKVEV